MSKEKQKNKYAAFSLIEVLASLFLFTIALVGVVGLMAGEIWKAMEKRNETIAGQLSQEGIELVRNIRDNNWVEGKTGNAVFDHISEGEFIIDYNSSLSPFSITNNNLYLSGEIYSHNASAGNNTVFKRKIIIESSGGNQRRVRSLVVWNRDNFPTFANCDTPDRCFYTETILSNDWGAIE